VIGASEVVAMGHIGPVRKRYEVLSSTAFPSGSAAEVAPPDPADAAPTRRGNEPDPRVTERRRGD